MTLGPFCLEARMYIAGKRLRVDGEWREPGDPVPEADGWRSSVVSGLVGSRRLIHVHDVSDMTTHPSAPDAPEPVHDDEPVSAPRVVPPADDISGLTVGEAIRFALGAPPEVVYEMLQEEREGKRRVTLMAGLSQILEESGA